MLSALPRLSTDQRRRVFRRVLRRVFRGVFRRVGHVLPEAPEAENPPQTADTPCTATVGRDGTGRARQSATDVRVDCLAPATRAAVRRRPLIVLGREEHTRLSAGEEPREILRWTTVSIASGSELLKVSRVYFVLC